jgi:hypothetical protein
MTGLDPVIQAPLFLTFASSLDGRVKPGHDGRGVASAIMTTGVAVC